MTALSANDDREGPPWDGLLDVDTAELSRDGRVLLGRVRGEPGLDDRRRAPVLGPQPDNPSGWKDVWEPFDRACRGPLEREDVRAGVACHDEALRTHLDHQALQGHRCLLIVVHHEMVE